jgi:hypothetical protein
MKKTDMLEHLASLPFFADVIKTMEEGKLIRPELDPVSGEGIETLGEMTHIEKVLYSIAARCTDEQKAILESSPIEEPGRNTKLGALQDRSDIAYDFLFNNVKTRLLKKWSTMKIKGPQSLGLSFHSDFSITFQLIDTGIDSPPEPKAAKKAEPQPPSIHLPGNKTHH